MVPEGSKSKIDVALEATGARVDRVHVRAGVDPHLRAVRDDGVAGHRGYIRRILTYRRMSGNDRASDHESTAEHECDERGEHEPDDLPHISRILR